MIVAKVRIMDEVYTYTSAGWTGPAGPALDVLNLGYRPSGGHLKNPVRYGARLAAKDLDGEILSIEDIDEPQDSAAPPQDDTAPEVEGN